METPEVVEAYLSPPFTADAHRWQEEPRQTGGGTITHRHTCAWEWMVEAYFGRMRNDNFLPNSTVTSVPPDSRDVTELGAFQFNITIPVPWALRAIAGKPEATMIERGYVDTERRELTLVCWASWGTIGFCTEKSVYSAVPAEQGGGCVLTKTNRVEIYTSMLPKWAVDTFWRVKNRNFPKSRAEHEQLAVRLMEREGRQPGRAVPTLPKTWGLHGAASPRPTSIPSAARPTSARSAEQSSAVDAETPATDDKVEQAVTSPQGPPLTKVIVLGSEDRSSRAVQRRAKARKASACLCARRPAKSVADRRPSRVRSPNGSALHSTENEVWQQAPAGWAPQSESETPRSLRKTTSNTAVAKKILAQPAAMGTTELMTLLATAEAVTQKFSLMNFSRSDRALTDSGQSEPEGEESSGDDEAWSTPRTNFPPDSIYTR